MRFLLWLFLLLTLAAPAVQADAPDVDAILRKLVENSEDPQVVSRRNSIAYQRTSRVEYLNEDGTKKRDTIRVFKISPENGRSVTRLISVNGRPAAD